MSRSLTPPRTRADSVGPMPIRRLAIGLITVCALLAQTSAFAWSPRSALPHKVTPTQTQQAMHCHDGAAQDHRNAHQCCCGDQCGCDEFCSNASVGMPPEFTGIGELIAAHFEALNAARAVIPAPPRSHLRPPISNPS